MAETKQKWLKTAKHGREILKIWRKRGMNNYSGQGLARYGAAGYSIELETNFTSFHNHGECLY